MTKTYKLFSPVPSEANFMMACDDVIIGGKFTGVMLEYTANYLKKSTVPAVPPDL